MTYNLRGIKNVKMVTTLEGKGTEDSPYRHVHHIFDGEELVGVIDTLTPTNPPNTQV